MNILDTINAKRLASINIKIPHDSLRYRIMTRYDDWFRDNDIIFYKYYVNDIVVYALNEEDALIFKLKFGI